MALEPPHISSESPVHGMSQLELSMASPGDSMTLSQSEQAIQMLKEHRTTLFVQHS